MKASLRSPFVRAAFLLASCAPAGIVSAADCVSGTTYNVPGSYSCTVPPGVTSIAVTAIGAGGGGGASTAVVGSVGGNGGGGGMVTGTIPVSPGDTLTFDVGGGGGGGGAGSATANGGGGGGSSNVTNTTAATVLIVAAGGGGGGGGDAGTVGGAGGNGDSSNGGVAGSGAVGGSGGSSGSGGGAPSGAGAGGSGFGGPGGASGLGGTQGTAGTGSGTGTGGSGSQFSTWSGGGGGGGWGGGGGGGLNGFSSTGGGGGGGSFGGSLSVAPNGGTGGTNATGMSGGNGSITITLGVPAVERQALLDLYAATNGPGWTVSTGWGGPPATECTWYGIACDGGGHVTGISLLANNLVGTIPPTIGDLTSLTYLYLNQNQLSGPIPSTIGTLTALGTLQLFANQLSGPIPSTIGSLTSLVSIDVSRNLLTGPVPIEIGNLFSLSSLYIYSNSLTGPLPTSLTNLSELTWVGIGYNGLYSTDSGLTAFLDALAPGWQNTQTVAPTGVAASGANATSILVSWTPIAYTADPGYYEVLASTIPGNWAPVGTTADKTASSMVVPAQPLWPTDFKVRTVTLPHQSNAATVTSDDSAVASGTTVPCTYGLVPPGGTSVPAPGGTGLTFDVQASPADCAWTAGTVDPWIALTGGTSGSGNGTVTFDVAPNSGPLRTGFVNVNGTTNPVGLSFSVDQADGCAASTSLVPASTSATAAGVTGASFQIATTGGCPWTVAANDPWITVTSAASGAGPATVTVDVGANPGLSRIGTVTAAGLTFTVNQADGCAANTTLVPAATAVPAAGATGVSFQIATTGGCPWTVAANDPWISVTSAASGAGPATVTVDVGVNPGLSRIGTVTAAGLTFTVNQADGCAASITLDPTGASVPGEGSARETFWVLAAQGCAWTAASNDPWITVVESPSGVGPAFVGYAVASNPGPARVGTITVSGRTFTVSQAEGCAAATTLVPTSAAVSAAGAAGQSFQLLTTAGCPWTAVPGVAWITVTSGGSGTGDGVVTYDVAPNPGPARSGTITAGGQSFTVSQAEGCTGGLTLVPDRAAVPAAGATGQTFAVQAAAGCPWTAVPQVAWLAVSSGAAGTGPGTVTYDVAGNDGAARRGTIVVGGKSFVVDQTFACKNPATPAFTSYPVAPIVAGTSFTLAWGAVPDLPPSGSYEVVLSTEADCGSPTVIGTTDLAVTIPTDPAAEVTWCARVRALAGPDCGPGFVSGLSAPVTVISRPLPPEFAVIQEQAPPARVDAGGLPPTGSTVVFRNVGQAAGSLALTASGGFFTTAPEGPLDLAPGAEAIVTLVFTADSTVAAGVRTGELVGTWNAGGETESVSAVVTLTVLEAPAAPAPGARIEPLGSNRVHFRKVGGNPDPQEIAVRNTGEVAVRIAPAIGPGGAWLSIAGDFGSLLEPGAERSFELSVDRSRRTSSDGAPPLGTTLRIENVDGNPEDAAWFDVVDEEPPAPAAGANRPALGETEFSVIMGSSVSTTQQNLPGGRLVHTGAQFQSDGWIRNRSADEVTVDLYYTPDGLDGVSDARVKKNSVKLSGYGGYRLSDFVKGLFGESGSGRVELRSGQMPQLSIRSTVGSITFRDGIPTEYGAELPLLVSGDGVARTEGADTRLVGVLTGLKGPNAGSRTNVIFSETAGEPTQVRARLFDAAGRLLGEKAIAVSAYSKTQVNYTDPELFPVAYGEGTLVFVATAGDGAVAAVATVLDNVTESYVVRVAAVLERPSAPASRASARPLAAAPGVVGLLPSVEHAATTEALYTTRLSVTNGSEADVPLEVTFLPEAGRGTPSGPKTLVVPGTTAEGGPRTVVFEDVLKELLGVDGDARGMLKVQGVLADLVFSSETTTPLDLEKPEAGRSASSITPAPGVTSKFQGVFTRDSQEAVGMKLSSTDAVKQEVSHPAIEESAAFRTDLVLAEVSGEAAKVQVRLRKTGGATLGDPLVVNLLPYERKQLDRIAVAVLKPSSGKVDVKDVEIAVQALDGKGRAVALVTKVANDPASRQSATFVLGPPVTGSASRAGRK